MLSPTQVAVLTSTLNRWMTLSDIIKAVYEATKGKINLDYGSLYYTGQLNSALLEELVKQGYLEVETRGESILTSEFLFRTTPLGENALSGFNRSKETQ